MGNYPPFSRSRKKSLWLNHVSSSSVSQKFIVYAVLFLIELFFVRVCYVLNRGVNNAIESNSVTKSIDSGVISYDPMTRLLISKNCSNELDTQVAESPEVTISNINSDETETETTHSSSVRRESIISLQASSMGIYNSSGLYHYVRKEEYSPEKMVIWNNEKPSSNKYLLVLALSAEGKSFSPIISNTLYALNLLQKHFSFRALMFSASPDAVRLCKMFNIDLMPTYLSNYVGLPIVREMLKTLRTLYASHYYGYINSDILLSPSIFPVLDFLLEPKQRSKLTEGFLVSGVAFDIEIPHLKPGSLKDYWHYINQLDNKKQFRERCSSDCWVFHESTDFDDFEGVVVGRGMVDTYLMSRVDEMKHSLVDVTYAAIMLHQGYDNYDKKALKTGINEVNKRYNEFFFFMHFLPKICMSIPGDWVVYWDNSKLQLTLWDRNTDRRERQREKYIASVRTRTDQLPADYK